MGLFSNPNEEKRKQSLQSMEDARLRFAEKMQKENFAPTKMLLVTTDLGGYVGLCRDKDQFCAIISPDFGADGEFILERFPSPILRREDVFEAAEGMGGAFGFGKKGATGFKLIIERENGDLTIPFIVNRSAAAIANAKNPALSTKRRRGNANLVWDFQPVDKRFLNKLEQELKEMLG